MFDAQGRLVASNPHYARMYALNPTQLVPGVTLSHLLDLRYATPARPKMPQDEYCLWLARPAADRRSATNEIALCNGRIISVHRQTMDDGSWVATHEDVTHRSRNEAQIAFLARHDALTGLPNRMLFRERLNAALAIAGEPGQGVAVLYLDLDRFKSINDTLGHPIGDTLLCEVGARLRRCTREADTVARLGGDEFAIIQRGVDRESQAADLAHRILAALAAPFHIDAHIIGTNTSIGVTLAPRDGTQATRLLKNADLGLYDAKEGGRGTVRFFTAQMNAAMVARQQLDAELRRAVAQGEFELHYQPQHSLLTGEIVGFEALLRWRHPERGILTSAQFIEAAEDIGLMPQLGRWTLHRACLDAAGWPGRPRVAVNLSPVQFRDPALADTVIDALRLAGLPADRLELELPEACLRPAPDDSAALIGRLRDLGIRIALDDFGADQGSILHLMRCRFTRLKIDSGLIARLDTSRETETLLRGLIGIAGGLGLATTAEGVERASQADLLRQTACGDAQGAFFGQLLPADQAARLLREPGAGPARQSIVFEDLI